MTFLTKLQAFDNRWDLAFSDKCGDTLTFCVEHFLYIAKEALTNRGSFFVALSGGSSPKAVFEKLSHHQYQDQIDWSNVYLFWSDERSVPPNHPESNYKMAMDAGFGNLPIPSDHIHRMIAEEDIEEEALNYENIIKKMIPDQVFDLVILGIGEDGHTASLFPKTHGLHTINRLVIANYIPKLDTWRMSLTYSCINKARHIAVYALGASKAKIIAEVFNSQYDPDKLPIQRIGTPTNKCLWIFDDQSEKLLKKSLKT